MRNSISQNDNETLKLGRLQFDSSQAVEEHSTLILFLNERIPLVKQR